MGLRAACTVRHYATALSVCVCMCVRVPLPPLPVRASVDRQLRLPLLTHVTPRFLNLCKLYVVARDIHVAPVRRCYELANFATRHIMKLKVALDDILTLLRADMNSPFPFVEYRFPLFIYCHFIFNFTVG